MCLKLELPGVAGLPVGRLPTETESASLVAVATDRWAGDECG